MVNYLGPMSNRRERVLIKAPISINTVLINVTMGGACLVWC